mmetsp:Transcript_74326/g.215403  ORF Transcript_74326/g.215403 Transcript_74326/m.215403 type:complete len:222 (-) Transcript_74326:1767-2432(-)
MWGSPTPLRRARRRAPAAAAMFSVIVANRWCRCLSSRRCRYAARSASRRKPARAAATRLSWTTRRTPLTPPRRPGTRDLLWRIIRRLLKRRCGLADLECLHPAGRALLWMFRQPLRRRFGLADLESPGPAGRALLWMFRRPGRRSGQADLDCLGLAGRALMLRRMPRSRLAQLECACQPGRKLTRTRCIPKGLGCRGARGGRLMRRRGPRCRRTLARGKLC